MASVDQIHSHHQMDTANQVIESPSAMNVDWERGVVSTYLLSHM